MDIYPYMGTIGRGFDVYPYMVTYPLIYIHIWLHIQLLMYIHIFSKIPNCITKKQIAIITIPILLKNAIKNRKK